MMSNSQNCFELTQNTNLIDNLKNLETFITNKIPDGIDLKNIMKAIDTLKVTSLRLPIFCETNKPFLFIKIMNFSEKYRVSLNPDFLKKYNLGFKILRGQTLEDFLKNLSPKHKSVLKFIEPNKNNNQNTRTNIYLKLPNKNSNLKINKHTIVLENEEFGDGKTIIDKYQFYKDSEKTTIFIIDRFFGTETNSSIAFISENNSGNNYNIVEEFLDEYIKLF